MSTTALHIIQLVKSLPDEEQQVICDAITRGRPTPQPARRRQLQRLPDGTFLNPDGIPNDDPIFKILEEIEEERHRMPGPPPPDFD